MARLIRPYNTLHHECAGTSGPEVLLVQGLGVTGEAYLRQVEVLSQTCRTLIFDNRGIGRSLPCTGPISIGAMAEDARALIDARWPISGIGGSEARFDARSLRVRILGDVRIASIQGYFLEIT